MFVNNNYKLKFFLDNNFLINNNNIYTNIKSFDIIECYLQKLLISNIPSIKDQTIFSIEMDGKILLKLFINLSTLSSFTRAAGPIGKI